MAFRRDDKDRKKGGFTYKPPSADKVKERAAREGRRFDSMFKQGFDTYKPHVGDNTVRVLPPTWDGHDHFGLTVYAHRYIGADKASYLCPKKMRNKPCCICDAEAEAKKSGDKDEATALRCSELIIYWIIDREEDETAPLLYTVSWSQDRDICQLVINKKTGQVLMIDHPDEGFDILFRRIGQGLKTRYSGWQIDRDPTPINDDDKKQRDILRYIEENPVPSVLNFYPNEYLEGVLMGATEKDDDSKDSDEDDKKPRRGDRDEDEERPAKRKDRDEDEDEKPAKRASRDRDEDDERPSRSTSRSAGREADSDEPTSRRRPRDDDDERPARKGRDEEDDERPAKRKPVEDDELPAAMRSKATKDDKPARRRLSDTKDEDPDERPAKRRARDDDDEEETRPAKRKPVEDEDEERPARRSSSRDRDEDEERPARRARDEEDEETRPASRRKPVEDDEDERPARRR